ncbi:hypothetical protein C7S20_09245 [Christiangramia fulva]|uniref:Signal transduction histidine kinase internal region domain-containing protein n=1 Tax=Christiangramia fulva TaxID=2126553 RepID=A0A2R3Z595_9FLAO|nr:histidine kinase [Christiangramia fulva]AVR45440.1 hypothetical protein C7S20_09245 [Christiangramia fulva]
MQTGGNRLIAYFYLRNNLKTIHKGILNKDSGERKNLKKKLLFFLKKAGRAAFVTITVYELFFFLNLGRFLNWEEFINTPFIQLEVGLAFIFFLMLFLIFPFISTFINEGKVSKLNPLLRLIIEVFLVIFCSILLLSLFNYGPLFIFTDVKPSADRLRTGYLVTSVFALFFYYFVEREQHKKKLRAEMLRSAQIQKENFQAQLQNLKNQVNPHFLFNSLNVLGTLIYKDQDQAVEFTRRLSDLYRAFLDTSNEPLIPLKKELEIVKSYIYLLKTRFGEAVDFHMEITSEEEYYLPPGTLQMLIENAIKHNGSTRKSPLQIHIIKSGNILEVRNRLKPRREKINSTHTGLKNIESRYRFLTDRIPEFKKTEKEFIARLPLLKVEDYEHSHH